MNKIIYLDNAATTRVDPLVLGTFNKAKEDYFANPSSIHKLGQEAAYVLNKSKENILRLLNLKNHQVIYTSGATESNNLAIKGACLRYKNRGKHIITSIYEHPSVLEAFRQLETEFGFEVTYLKPNKDGVITSDNVLSNVRNDTIFVSIMAVNNEIGALNPIEEIGEGLKKYPKVIFHSDCSQFIGKTNKTLNLSKVDMITLSSHKIHGLLGYGALIKLKKIDLLPLNSGGGQEYNLRSGTNDLAGALAFEKALDLAISHSKERYEYVSALADVIIKHIASRGDEFELNIPHPYNPYIINFSSLKKKGSVIVEALSNYGVMVSSVSACHSSKEKGSYVVASLGKSDVAINNTIRVSLDYTNTKEEVEEFLTLLDKIVGEIR